MRLTMNAKPETPMGLIWELDSITQALDPLRMFPTVQPLEIELGCGDSTFLVDYAQLHPDRNFMGVERLKGRLKKLARKGARAGLTNLVGVRIESSYLLRYLLPPESVEAVHVYFPDPWPKRKHWKYRLINSEFPILTHRVLTMNGTIYLRTDNQEYFEQMMEVFGVASEFASVETPAGLLQIRTDFEKEFYARGISTLHAAYCRVR
jgi:tRNA (guanine-N7-)-methyltransferase